MLTSTKRAVVVVSVVVVAVAVEKTCFYAFCFLLYYPLDQCAYKNQLKTETNPHK